MTLGTLAFLWPAGKLAVVNVFVAVHAIRKRDRTLEVAADMTCDATDLCVFAQQRIFRLGMIERETRQNLFPTGCRVAVFAPLFEAAAMRIDVAGRACRKLHVLEARWPAGNVWLVTFFASHLNVQARKRIASLRVIELLRCLPVAHVVTALAIFSELPFVVILVTAHTIC